jgi:hypothetical protein
VRTGDADRPSYTRLTTPEATSRRSSTGHHHLTLRNGVGALPRKRTATGAPVSARAVGLPSRRSLDVVGELDDIAVGVGDLEGRVALLLPPLDLLDALLPEALPQGMDGLRVR